MSHSQLQNYQNTTKTLKNAKIGYRIVTHYDYSGNPNLRVIRELSLGNQNTLFERTENCLGLIRPNFQHLNFS